MSAKDITFSKRRQQSCETTYWKLTKHMTSN